MRFETDPQDL